MTIDKINKKTLGKLPNIAIFMVFLTASLGGLEFIGNYTLPDCLNSCAGCFGNVNYTNFMVACIFFILVISIIYGLTKTYLTERFGE